MQQSQYHDQAWIIFSALALFAVGACGCRAPLSAVPLSRSDPTARPQPHHSPTTAPADKPADSGGKAALAGHEEAMVAVLDELHQIEPIDPAAKESLLADLREAKPENWPLIVRQYQAALAYRKQLAAKERTAPQPVVEPDLHVLTPPRPGPTAEAVSLETKPEAVAAHRAPREPAVTSPRKQPQPTASPAEDPTQAVQASYVTPIEHPANWQEHLNLAIAGLEESTQPTPGTTDEVQAHMRLRLLKQLAGQDEGAMSPITGAPPGLQDYWAKQMFTISTFLDNRRQPDDKRRAAGSLVHLDQARAKLAELATLEVQNLTFVDVDSVAGYGVYERKESTRFRPGEHVSLYGEVENFRSVSSEEGFRTKLSSSYEVVDLRGQRVDGRDFPDVEDYCQSLRRDFHMQYGIDLPTRIYPGQYELRIIITDGLSHKIGQASVPFEIVE